VSTMKIEREVLTVQGTSEVELLRIAGSRAGPTLAVLGGVHGDEPEGVLAARGLFAQVQRREVHGTVVIVPIASPDAFAAGTRHSPLDGGNLARSFPGNPAGTPTERLAYLLTAAVIARCEVLVDLHAAGRDYRMPFFAGAVDDGSPTGQMSAAAARAFGAPLAWLHDAMNPGRTLSAAWERGVPAIYVESGGGGALRRADIDAYIDGVLAVMAHLGMIPRNSAGRRVARAELRGGTGDVDWGLTAPVDACLIPQVRPGDPVSRGQVIAQLWAANDDEPRLVESPCDGTAMMIRWRSQIRSGEVVAMLGPGKIWVEAQ
jgi:uncharacterized protein